MNLCEPYDINDLNFREESRARAHDSPPRARPQTLVLVYYRPEITTTLVRCSREHLNFGRVWRVMGKVRLNPIRAAHEKIQIFDSKTPIFSYLDFTLSHFDLILWERNCRSKRLYGWKVNKTGLKIIFRRFCAWLWSRQRREFPAFSIYITEETKIENSVNQAPMELKLRRLVKKYT